MADKPTIIIGSLNDKELTEAIDKLVQHVDNKAMEMAQNFDAAIGLMKGSLASLGKVRLDAITAANETSTKATAGVKKETQARKELTTTLDQQAAAMKKASAPGGGIIEQYDNQIVNLRKRLAEVRKDIDIFNYAIGSGKKTQVSWGQEGLRNANQEAERLMVAIATLEKQRGNLTSTLAPQGHFIENYVKSLQRANPELAQLNAMFRSGQSELQKQAAETRAITNNTIQYTDALKQQIQTIRSRKDATSAFEQISLLPQGTMDEISAKGKLLQELIAKVRDTPLMSQTNVKLAEKQMLSLAAQYAQLKRAKESVASTPSTDGSAEKKTEDAAKRLIPTLEDLRKKEEERKRELIQSGIAAQQQADKTLASIKAQQQAADYTQQINGVKELQSAMREMQRAYNVLPEGDPLKDSLQEKIKITKQAIDVATRYNMTVAGIGGIGGASGQAPKDTIAAYSAELQRLASIYRNLSNEERAASAGQGLKKKYQELGRTISVARAELERPINLKEALGGSEKTIDDIAYKLQRLQLYKRSLDTTNPQQMEQMQQVDTKMNELRQRLDSYNASVYKSIGANTALARSWNYMKNRLAFYFTVGASTQFVKTLIDIRGQYELLERSIGILIDSAQHGSQIFSELNAMAIKSPYTTMELGAAAKQLVAYDVAAKDVVDTTRRLADMAAAVGIPIERLTYALGQIKAYGYLNSRDARMFANAGIPLVKELADYYTELEGRLVSTADVYDRIKKKAVDYTDVMQVVNNMTDAGGKFFNFQEKAADTLKVKIANLTLAWNNMLNEIGEDGQGIIGGFLSSAKQIFEHWRDINNTITATITLLGVLKASQLVLYKIITGKTLTAMTAAFGPKLGARILSIGQSILSIVTPLNAAAAAAAILSVAFVKSIIDYRDLIAANEEFNRSIIKNAEENVKSIDKFFDEYGKQFEGLGSLSVSDQAKLWERVQEEIEKSVKNADGYISALEKIGNISERISAGVDVLDQSKNIQEELRRLAEREAFSLGGGFMDDEAAKDLREYEESLNTVVKLWGRAAFEAEKAGKPFGVNAWKEYKNDLNEVDAELTKLEEKFAGVNISAILGDSNDVDIQLANLRAFTDGWRDAFLATERGTKIGSEGRFLLNKYLDEWIVKQARANKLLVDQNGVFDEQRAMVESNRTAWGEFFRYLSKEEKATIDTAIKTNRLGSKEVRDIWDSAANKMKENSISAYNLIQDQIAQLRKTPAIVIDIIYKTKKENTDDQQKDFEESFIRPKQDRYYKTLEEYQEEEKKNREKYGRYNKKDGEDNVEWEKRLGDEYVANKKKLEALNAQLAENHKLDDVNRQAKEREVATLTEQQKVLDAVAKKQGFNYEQFEKGKSGKGGTKKDEFAETVKEEIKVIGEARKQLEEYRKTMSNTEAIRKVKESYGATFEMLDKKLQKFNTYGLGASDITSKDLREIRDYYSILLDIAKTRGSENAIEALDKAWADLGVSISKIDTKRMVESLNSELGKLKEEYELAVALDADPELGDVFSSYFGIDKEKLPHDFEQAAKLAQERIDKVLQENGYTGTAVDIRKLLDKAAFEQWAKENGLIIDNELRKAIDSFRQYLYKTQVDEIKSQEQMWKKLTEKYTSYQYKITQIERDADAERQALINKVGTPQQKKIAQTLVEEIKIAPTPDAKESARNDLKALAMELSEIDPATVKLNVAIDNEEMERKAREDFEEFQKSPTWITATGELGTLTRQAIGLLIDRIEEYKAKAKGLSGKEIKRINQALRTLRKEVHKDNPFYELADAIRYAKTIQSDYTKEIVAQERELEDLQYRQKQGVKLTANEQKRMEELIASIQKLKEEKKATGKVSFETILKAAKDIQAVFQTVTSSVSDMLDALGGTKASQALKDVNTVLDKMGQFASMGAAVGGAWGALAGAIVGGGMGLVQVLGDVLTGNADITEHVEESETALSRLEMRYKNLEHAIEKSYGVARVSALRAAQASKQAQLAEVERQLSLEQTRIGKYKDEDKIIELQGKANDLRNEINDMVDDFVNDLMGISSIGDAMENVVSSMIEAFKKGEDYMKEFDNSFAEMIDNMIVKSISSQLIGETIEKIAKKIKDAAWNRQALDVKQKEYEKLIGTGEGSIQWTREQIEKFGTVTSSPRSIEEYEEMIRQGRLAEESRIAGWVRMYREMEQKAASLEKELKKGLVVTPEDINSVRTDAEAARKQVQENFKALMDAYGITFGQDVEGAKLSNLQQGISQISEETAGSIEAYLNGVSQQVYLHSTLLTQIRDVMVTFDPEVSMGIQSQMLLQLQQSYQVQMSIESILQGVLNPSGRAFAVEIIS